MVWLITFLIVLIDLLSKYFIAGNELFHNYEVIPNFFSITYAENTGMAWSMLSDKTWLLTIFSFLGAGIIIYYILSHKLSTFKQFIFGLILGGALGNLFDRFFLGYVRDFLDFIIFGYDYPIFNIADSSLVIGMILLAIIVLKDEKK